MGRFDLAHFNDAELLSKLVAEGGADGLTAREFALSLGFKEDDSYGIAARATAMRDLGGVVEYDPERKLWRPSDSGYRLDEANSSSVTLEEIATWPMERMTDVLRQVTARYRADASAYDAWLMRREFGYGTTVGSAAWGRRNGGRRRR